jgi:hypothetical protein
LPHIEQLLALLVVSTQALAHTVAAALGQLATHVYVPPAPAQRGVLPAHVLPQLPQLAALDGSAQPSGQASNPVPQSGSTTATSGRAPASPGAPTSPAPAAPSAQPLHVPAE